VRQTYIDFFKSKAHDFIPSSPVVPHDDPTLLFANAGMNQFKPIFLGTVDPKNPLAKLKRAANSQKCIRAGGKHNDLDDVGKDTYHHTFFEMLGNWSFGDYFKKEAIDWSWELLTEVLKLPTDRIYVTVFGGNAQFNLPADDEARALWRKYLPEDRILDFGMKENFWEMGETGPCGPCTEIHFDRIGGRNAASLVNKDDPTVIEIWNNVFMQFNREAGGGLKPLPACHVDTGMGLERLVSILQQKMSNYDTDVFMPLFDAIQKVTGFPEPYTGKLGAEDAGKKDMAYRVVADHIRTLTFAITDGAEPGNDGRNYVLRRILRRAIRYGRDNLKAKPGFFSQLARVVQSTMSSAFPELNNNIERVVAVIKSEEESFERTLTRGIAHFEKIVARMAKDNEGKVISGKDTFILYDTYGFPRDLTELMAEEKGLKVDNADFNRHLDAAKERSRQANASVLDTSMQLDANGTSHLNKSGVPTTDDSFKYSLDDITAKVVAIWTAQGFANSVKAAPNTSVGLIFDKTNFYAEQGGQIFDIGSVYGDDGKIEFQVDNCQAYAGYVVHVGKLAAGEVKVGDALELHIDINRRRPIMSNHTSTHILNYALRKVLGDKVDQKGSLVDGDKLRFDFSHHDQVKTPQRRQGDLWQGHIHSVRHLRFPARSD